MMFLPSSLSLQPILQKRYLIVLITNIVPKFILILIQRVKFNNWKSIAIYGSFNLPYVAIMILIATYDETAAKGQVNGAQ